MAAPTNVRVEASSISSTTLRWSYSGGVALGIYRSTDGSAYTLITTVLASAISYEDAGLSAGTKYWYKLSDDGGSTFSSVVTVWTHGCISPAPGDGFALPRFDGEQQQADLINDMARRIEDTLQGRVLDPQECAVCPTDGRIEIDCSEGCRRFVVIADQYINSISIQMCDEGEGNIDFIIPPGDTRQICGWPAGFGFTGDECTDSPINGGTDGRTISVPFGSGRASPAAKSKPGYGPGVGRGGGGGGAACTCVPGGEGQLTIKSCNANNSLNCSSTKSGIFIGCGGKGPYTWSKTGTIVLSRTTGDRVTVTPPANSGSGVAGDAYQICWFHEARVPNCAAVGTVSLNSTKAFSCNDVASACNTTPGSCAGATPAVSTMPCIGSLGGCEKPECSTTGCTDGKQVLTDTRTPTMISNGCNPCGLAAAGATLTLTDAVGNSVTITLAA